METPKGNTRDVWIAVLATLIEVGIVSAWIFWAAILPVVRVTRSTGVGIWVATGMNDPAFWTSFWQTVPTLFHPKTIFWAIGDGVAFVAAGATVAGWVWIRNLLRKQRYFARLQLVPAIVLPFLIGVAWCAVSFRKYLHIFGVEIIRPSSAGLGFAEVFYTIPIGLLFMLATLGLAFFEIRHSKIPVSNNHGHRSNVNQINGDPN